MEEKQTQASGGVTHWHMEAFTAASLFIVGLVIMYDSYNVGMGWAPDGPETGYFPFRLGAIIAVSSIVIFVKAFLKEHRSHATFVSLEQFKQVLQVLIPTTIYVLLTQFIGIYVASTLFIGGFMKFVGKFHWLKIILVSVIVSATLFYAFEVQFGVPLPKGPLEALFGY